MKYLNPKLFTVSFPVFQEIAYTDLASLVYTSHSPVSLLGTINCPPWGLSLGYTARGSPTTDAISCPMSSSGITREADARRNSRITVGGGDATNRKKEDDLVS